jgi:hypothetical protein
MTEGGNSAHTLRHLRTEALRPRLRITLGQLRHNLLRTTTTGTRLGEVHHRGREGRHRRIHISKIVYHERHLLIRIIEPRPLLPVLGGMICLGQCLPRRRISGPSPQHPRCLTTNALRRPVLTGMAASATCCLHRLLLRIESMRERLHLCPRIILPMSPRLAPGLRPLATFSKHQAH